MPNISQRLGVSSIVHIFITMKTLKLPHIMPTQFGVTPAWLGYCSLSRFMIITQFVLYNFILITLFSTHDTFIYIHLNTRDTLFACLKRTYVTSVKRSQDLAFNRTKIGVSDKVIFLISV